jgi:putative DNA primase/helicase
MSGDIPSFTDSSLSDTDEADNLLSHEQLTHSTQDGIAHCFSERHAKNARYCPKHGSWYLWDSKRWNKDEKNAVTNYIRNIARVKNGSGQAGMGSLAFTKGAKGFAQSDPNLVIGHKELDKNNYLLNTPEGTYNLLTQTMQAHSHLDHITKSTTVAPTGFSGGVFLKFLAEITQDDVELQKFLQRSLGSILSGALEDHWIMFWIGDGRNGKNTLGDVVQYIMGDFAKKVSASLLLQRIQAGHPTELANLQGLRLAVSSEIPEGAYLNTSLIKELSGDGMISARFMHQDNFEFPRTHKNLVYGNNRPSLKISDPAMKSRMKIVRFGASFAGREDPDLPSKLEREAGFILSWLIEGHRMWLDNGKKIGSCAAVDRETADYYSAQTTPETWINENCLKVTGYQSNNRLLPANTLYKDYCTWSEERGEQPLSNTLWGEYMTQQGFEKKRTKSGMKYGGLELRQC